MTNYIIETQNEKSSEIIQNLLQDFGYLWGGEKTKKIDHTKENFLYIHPDEKLLYYHNRNTKDHTLINLNGLVDILIQQKVEEEKVKEAKIQKEKEEQERKFKEEEASKRVFLTLDLTEDQANTLYQILYVVGGDPEYSPRKYAKEVYEKLVKCCTKNPLYSQNVFEGGHEYALYFKRF